MTKTNLLIRYLLVLKKVYVWSLFFFVIFGMISLVEKNLKIILL